MVRPSGSPPRILLVNPVIHDFAAYDFWAKPLGLLIVGGMLLEAGLQVDLLDCTDPLSAWLPAPLRSRRRNLGRGKFARTPAPRPSMLPPLIDRRYSRYGLPPAQLDQALASLADPQAILVTSMMTYWYPGVIETIAALKRRWPGVPVILGGVYATLCPEHARAVSGADAIAPGPASIALPLVGELLAHPSLVHDLAAATPAHQLLPAADSAALLTSVGCPYRCLYCGVPALQPEYRRFSLQRVEQELRQLMQMPHLRDLALYDDAFFAAPNHALEVLHLLVQLGSPFRLHAASGLSPRHLSVEMAQALKQAGFVTLRLGLETSDPQRQRTLGDKVTSDDFVAALDHLAAAGFSREQIGVYVMIGLPGQSFDEVASTIETVQHASAQAHLTEYSPVPGSPLFAAAQAASPYDLSEPLFHNPTLLPCWPSPEDRRAIVTLRRRLHAARPCLR
jgi:radical SAM superfamily enzyme YgiQ (UPF0313 family)